MEARRGHCIPRIWSLPMSLEPELQPSMLITAELALQPLDSELNGLLGGGGNWWWSLVQGSEDQGLPTDQKGIPTEVWQFCSGGGRFPQQSVPVLAPGKGFLMVRSSQMFRGHSFPWLWHVVFIAQFLFSPWTCLGLPLVQCQAPGLCCEVWVQGGRQGRGCSSRTAVLWEGLQIVDWAVCSLLSPSLASITLIIPIETDALKVKATSRQEFRLPFTMLLKPGLLCEQAVTPQGPFQGAAVWMYRLDLTILLLTKHTGWEQSFYGGIWSFPPSSNWGSQSEQTHCLGQGPSTTQVLQRLFGMCLLDPVFPHTDVQKVQSKTKQKINEPLL